MPRKTYNGSCHCGRVKFRVTADIDHVRVCDCSICRKRGALNFRVPEADFQLPTPIDELSLYQWGTFTAKDYFCPVCGILAFRRPRHRTNAEIESGQTDVWTVNARCLEGLDLAALPQRAVYGSRLP